MTYTPRKPRTAAMPSGDYGGINTLVVGVKRRTPRGYIVETITPTYPEVVEAWAANEPPDTAVIAVLGLPNATGNLPEITCYRTDIALPDGFRTQCVRSRDRYAMTREAVYAPGINLQPGDVVQMPLAMETALEGLLQQTDMTDGRYLGADEEFRF